MSGKLCRLCKCNFAAIIAEFKKLSLNIAHFYLIINNFYFMSQTRHDLFSEAVRQALARQTGAMKKQQKRESAEIDCKGLLTGSELRFLLKQDS